MNTLAETTVIVAPYLVEIEEKVGSELTIKQVASVINACHDMPEMLENPKDLVETSVLALNLAASLGIK